MLLPISALSSMCDSIFLLCVFVLSMIKSLLWGIKTTYLLDALCSIPSSSIPSEAGIEAESRKWKWESSVCQEEQSKTRKHWLQVLNWIFGVGVWKQSFLKWTEQKEGERETSDDLRKGRKPCTQRSTLDNAVEFNWYFYKPSEITESVFRPCRAWGAKHPQGRKKHKLSHIKLHASAQTWPSSQGLRSLSQGSG